MKQGQYFVTIPVQLARAKSWNKGDQIIALIDKNGDITLKKKE